VGAVRDSAVLLFVCLFVRLSAVCEIFDVIRYVAAPGGERAGAYRIVSDTLVLLVLA